MILINDRLKLKDHNAASVNTTDSIQRGRKISYDSSVHSRFFKLALLADVAQVKLPTQCQMPYSPYRFVAFKALLMLFYTELGIS